jgi:hypothetical protein
MVSEIAWAGTAAAPADEWIEIANPGDVAVSLSGWTLETDSGSLHVALSGTIPAHGFFLLERDDDAVVDVRADQLFTGTLPTTASACGCAIRTAISSTAPTPTPGHGLAGTPTARAQWSAATCSARLGRQLDQQ